MDLNYSKTNILVTGADGFIGSHLCEALVHLGGNVTALVYYNSYNKIGWLDDLPQKVKENINIIPGDIQDAEFILKITKNIDVIFHLAALISIPYSYSAPRSYLNTNTLGMLNILEASKQNQISRLIATSTSEVYGSALSPRIDEEHKIQAQSPYSASKVAADFLLESYVRSFSIPAVILRPFNTYGPRQSEKAVIASIIRQVVDDSFAEIRVGNIFTKRDFNYVNDTVRAFNLLGKADEKKIIYGSVYNSGTGVSVTIDTIIKKIIDISNSNKKVVIENDRFRPKKSEVNHLIASSEKLKNLTGWKAEINLDTGLRYVIEWWMDRKKEIR